MNEHTQPVVAAGSDVDQRIAEIEALRATFAGMLEVKPPARTPYARGCYLVSVIKDEALPALDAVLATLRERIESGRSLVEENTRLTATLATMRDTFRQLDANELPPHCAVASLRAATAGGARASAPTETPAMTMERFRDLAAQWHRETSHISSITKILEAPAYRQIVAAGPVVLPMIFALMREGDLGWWFPLLRELTGENPIPKGHRGNVTAMRDDWLAWRAAQSTPETPDQSAASVETPERTPE